MKNLWILAGVVLVLVVGCGDMPKVAHPIRTRQDQPLEVKIVNAPNATQELQIKALEARVKELEQWATKQGGRMR